MIICVKNLSKAKTSRGSFYYSFRAICENEDKIDAKIWDIGDELKENSIIDAENAQKDNYKGKEQLIIKSYNLVDEKIAKKYEYLANDKAIKIDQNKCYAYIKHMINKTGIYEKIVSEIIKDNEKEFLEAFGAKSVHHNFKGGLLIHTYYVLKNCEALFTVYEDLIDKELLFAAAILHDIGKIKTYVEKEDGTIGNTTDYLLMDHIYLGAKAVGEYYAKNRNLQINIPYDKINLLEHCILAHHGQKDWGSPVQPAIFTAQLLHFADNIDAKYGVWKEALFETDKKEVMTDKVFSLGGSLLNREI